MGNSPLEPIPTVRLYLHISGLVAGAKVSPCGLRVILIGYVNANGVIVGVVGGRAAMKICHGTACVRSRTRDWLVSNVAFLVPAWDNKYSK
jgi:hypothetical protein